MEKFAPKMIYTPLSTDYSHFYHEKTQFIHMVMHNLWT